MKKRTRMIIRTICLSLILFFVRLHFRKSLCLCLQQKLTSLLPILYPPFLPVLLPATRPAATGPI